MKTKAPFSLLVIAFVIMFAAGYEIIEDPEGTDDPRDNMTGTWQFIENSAKSTQSLSYTVNISKDPDNSSQVILENFCNPGTFDVQSVGIATTSQIVVTEQTLSNGWTVKGSGKLEGTEKMKWTYSITAGGDIEEYTAEATKL